VINFGPEKREKVLAEFGREDPLIAKDIGHVLSMIFIPGASGNSLSRLLDDGILDDEKEGGMGLDAQHVKESLQSRFHNLLHRPSALSREPGEAGKRSRQESNIQRSNYRTGVSLFAQLDKANDKTRQTPFLGHSNSAMLLAYHRATAFFIKS
jgi:hypothetical protein